MVVGRQQGGLCAAACFEHGCGLFHGGWVHPGERLVQQEGVTLGPEGTQEGGAPLLAAGELPGRQGEGLIIESKLYKVFPYLLFVLRFALYCSAGSTSATFSSGVSWGQSRSS